MTSVQSESGNSSEEDKYNTKMSLIVNYLPKHFTYQDMKNFFASIGEIENCTLMRDKKEGFSLGYGFVTYKNPDDSRAAIDKLNGLKLANKILKVAYARPSSDAIKGTNVYISGLPKNIREEELLELCKKYGGIIDHKLLRTNVAGIDEASIRSAALVRYDKRAEAEKAIHELNGKTPPGMSNPLIVRFAFSPEAKAQKRAFEEYNHMDYRPGKMNRGPPFPPGNDGFMYDGFGFPYPPDPMMSGGNNYYQGDEASLFVYNLGKETEEKDLWKLFAPFGAISSITIKKEKRFAFVNMASVRDAEAAIQALNRTIYNDRILQVSFKASKY